MLVADGSVGSLTPGSIEGASLKVGAVAAVRRFKNPISIARRVLEASEHHFLVGPALRPSPEAQGFVPVEQPESRRPQGTRLL